VDKYNWSFYFWLDFLSILAMFLDVDWVYDGLIYGVSGQEAGVSKKSQNGNAKTLGNIFRAGRAAKIGSRAIRVLRIVRLLRLNKLYKSSEKYLEKKKKLEDSKNMNSNKSNSISYSTGHSESKLGKKLSDLTTSRLIILVLTLMIGIILFNSSFYYESKKSMELGIKIFKTFDKNDPNINLTFDIYVKEHIYISSPILYAQVGDLVYGDYNFTESLRPSEKIIAFDDCLNIDPDPEIGYVN